VGLREQIRVKRGKRTGEKLSFKGEKVRQRKRRGGHLRGITGKCNRISFLLPVSTSISLIVPYIIAVCMYLAYENHLFLGTLLGYSLYLKRVVLLPS
jgi:hypothetical protein